MRRIVTPTVVFLLFVQCNNIDKSEKLERKYNEVKMTGVKFFLDKKFLECIEESIFCECKSVSSFPMIIMDFSSSKIKVTDSRYNGYEFNIFKFRKDKRGNYKIIDSENFNASLRNDGKNYFFSSGNSENEMVEVVLDSSEYLTGWEVFDVIRTNSLDSYLQRKYNFSTSNELNINEYRLKCFKSIESSLIVLNEKGNHVLELRDQGIRIFKLGEMNYGLDMVIDTNYIKTIPTKR